MNKIFIHIPIISTLSFITDNIKAARKEAKLNQDFVADKLGVPRSTYAHWEGGANIDHDMIAAIAKILGYKYKELIDEDFIIKHQMNEPEARYKTKRKSLNDVKVVDANSLLVHDLMIAKAMLRVMLRNQAELLATQHNVSVTSVLKKITNAVRAETSEDFDEL